MAFHSNAEEDRHWLRVLRGWRSASRRLGLVPALCIIVLVGAALLATVAPLVLRTGEGSVDLRAVMRPMPWGDGGSWDHPLGTDSLGRDELGQLVRGARVSMLVGTLSVMLAGVLGVGLGILSGYLGGWIDAIVSRLVDVQMSLPFLVVALGAVVALGPSLGTVVFVVGITGWVPYARIIRSEVLSLRERDHVTLARTAGLTWLAIAVRQIWPNVRPSVVVLATLDFGRAIVTEAGLSFLGLGVQPPETSWGLMIAEAQVHVTTNPRLILIPSVVIVLVTLSANLFGDWLRDRLDPTLEVVM